MHVLQNHPEVSALGCIRKQKADKEKRHSRKNQEAQRSKEELSSLEKAKQEYDLWVLTEEYEEYER